MCFLRDEEEDKWDEEREEGDENGGEKGLNEFFLPGVGLKVVVLKGGERRVSTG